ncbi:hypothetical protein [Pectinatus frisingensis]|uniref:hypothetical protein n=1 Tax=Pectinatus frisingensis TaxID=865 RepID=UPI0018C6232C|nr:hypothetical protein [Pectinatus frisingensis]
MISNEELDNFIWSFNQGMVDSKRPDILFKLLQELKERRKIDKQLKEGLIETRKWLDKEVRK